jgi:hypothetical protein
MTVAGLSKEIGVTKTSECPYTNPPCDFKADIANNQILEAARKDADAFEREFEAEIRLRCENAEETIGDINMMFAYDIQARLSAKRSVAIYWELQKMRTDFLCGQRS